jgi:hypothetical protein
LAASCIPLVKSNANATKTTKITNTKFKSIMQLFMANAFRQTFSRNTTSATARTLAYFSAEK